MYSLILLAHLLAACIWTGGHLILALRILPEALRQGDVTAIQAFEWRYEPLGLPALAIQVASGLWLANARQPDWGRWLDPADPASAPIAAKLLLLGLTVILALHARLRLIPDLSAARLPALARHIAGVTVLAVLFVVAGVSLRTGGF